MSFGAHLTRHLYPETDSLQFFMVLLTGSLPEGVSLAYIMPLNARVDRLDKVLPSGEFGVFFDHEGMRLEILVSFVLQMTNVFLE